MGLTSGGLDVPLLTRSRSLDSPGSLTISSCLGNDGNQRTLRAWPNCRQIAHLHPGATTQLSLARLIDFFKYFSREFSYGLGVASIRAGLLKKDSKGWSTDVSSVTTFSFRNAHSTSLIQ